MSFDSDESFYYREGYKDALKAHEKTLTNLRARLNKAERVIDYAIEKHAKHKSLGLESFKICELAIQMECEDYRKEFPKE